MNWDHNADQDDPLLDACLDEVLAGRMPPDVTPRVLRALDAAAMPEPPPVQPRSPAPALITVSLPAPGSQWQASDLPSSAPTATWQSALAMAVAASVVGIGLTWGIVSLFRGPPAQVAEHKIAPPPNAAVAPRSAAASPTADSQLATQSAAPGVSTDVVPQPVEPLEPLPRLTINPLPSAAPATAPLPDQPLVEAAPRSAAPAEQIVSFVNAELRTAWTSAGVTASPAISDDEWCARLFQRTLGRGPTAAERQQFRNDDAATRRAALLDRLLGDQYHTLFARNWARVLTTELLGTSVARADSLASREDLVRYLTSSLRSNKALPTIVTELLTARGTTKPGPGYNPAVNFLVDGWEPTGSVATSRVARVLLGERLDCARCHKHPTAAWTPEDYWSFNAFFRQMKVETTDEATRLVNVDFAGERRGSRDGEVFFETPEGLVKTAWPRFLDGTQIGTSGQLATVNRRQELARLVAKSEYLPRAVVDHVWSHYFDYGLLPSLANLAPSSPLQEELLARLSSEFVASGYDLKNLIRWTVMSEAFDRSTKLADLATSDMPEAGNPALFSRYYSRPAADVEVLTSLVQAQRIRRSSGSTAERDRARVDWLAQFNRAASKIGPKAAAKNSSILAEASTIRVTAGLQATGLVAKIAVHDMPFDKKVDHIFLAALGRLPTAREARTAAAVLTTAGDSHAAALEDIWWSLLASNECILDR